MMLKYTMLSCRPSDLMRWLAGQTFSLVVSMFATLVKKVTGSTPTMVIWWKCFIDAVNEIRLGCSVWRDTWPPLVGWHGAVRVVHGFFISVTSGWRLHLLLGRSGWSLRLLERSVISPSVHDELLATWLAVLTFSQVVSTSTSQVQCCGFNPQCG